MQITLAQLKQIMPYAGKRAALFLAPLNAAMAEFGIDTPARQAAFLAQLAHESGSLVYVKEIASGRAYEGRADLGNVNPGDGFKFKGRALIQITGRSNYRACSMALFQDERLLDHPELLENVIQACRASAWFWQAHKLNTLADVADAPSFRAITRTINGGFNGLTERIAYYNRAKEVLA